MLFKSEVLTQASGSIGGTTYSHNASGMYRRARAIPVNPNTSLQVAVRAAFTAAVTRWTSVLTATQRAAWDLYAASVPVLNPLGDSVFRSGQNWYVACNTPRLQANIALSLALSNSAYVDDAPTTFDRGDFTTPFVTFSEASGISVLYTNTDDWAGEADSVLLIYQGLPKNASAKFFKNPWRLIGAVEGAATPPTPPEAIAAATLTSIGYTITAGQNDCIAVAVTRADGRLSTRRIIGPTVVGS